MGALLVEEYYEQNRQKIAKRKEESGGVIKFKEKFKY